MTSLGEIAPSPEIFEEVAPTSSCSVAGSTLSDGGPGGRSGFTASRCSCRALFFILRCDFLRGAPSGWGGGDLSLGRGLDSAGAVSGRCVTSAAQSRRVEPCLGSVSSGTEEAVFFFVGLFCLPFAKAACFSSALFKCQLSRATRGHRSSRTCWKSDRMAHNTLLHILQSACLVVR